MRRFSSMTYAPAETRRILRDRMARYLPVQHSAPARPNAGNLVRDELLLNLLLNLDIVFESDVDRARATYEAALAPDSGEPSFDEVISAGWLRIVWGRVATPFEIDQRARATPAGTMTALVALLKKRFEESYVLGEAARGSADLSALVAAIERGDLSPGSLRSQDPKWVVARLWDRVVTGPGPHSAKLHAWVDRWRLLGFPSLVPHEAWSETSVDAFCETAMSVLESEQSLVGWEETRSGFVRQMALRSGQPTESAERYVPPVPATVVDRAAWLGDLRLEGVIAGAMSANGDLVGLIRLILSDVEAEEFSPAPHALAGKLIALALQRPEIFVVVLFRLSWSPVLLADLLLYPATSALACSLIAPWPGMSGAWDQELRARDDQTTKVIAFADAVSVFGQFLEQGSAAPGEAASLLDFLHRTVKPVFGEEAATIDPMLAILREEIASQSPVIQQAIFASLASKLPQAGLGTSTFAAALDIVDVGELAGAVDPAPLISAYNDSIDGGAYALSTNRINVSAATALVKLAMSAPDALRQQFFLPIDVKSRMAAASAPDANPFTVEDEIARSVRAHVRILCRAVSGFGESTPDDLADALIKAVHMGAVKHDEKGRVAAFSARFETDPFRGLRDRPIAADLAAALLALGNGHRERLLAALLDIDEPAVLARLSVLAPLATRDRIARRIASLDPTDAGNIRSLPEALLRIEELIAAGASDAAAKFIDAERGLKTFGQVPGRELTRVTLDLRLKYLRGDWPGIAATEPPSGLSGEAKDSAVTTIYFYRGLAALADPAGDRKGAEDLFASLHHRHPEVAAYAVNLFAARISGLLGNDLFARLQGEDVVYGRKALIEAEGSMLHVRNLSAADQDIFNCNKALLLLALGQSNEANEALAAITPIGLRDRAAAYSAVALSRTGRLREALAVLDEAETTAGKTQVLQAARDHIRTGKHFAATANLSSDDNLTTRIQSALFQFAQMAPSQQAAILIDAPDPLEKLITNEIRTAAARVTSLAPMMTNVAIDSCEDDLSAHLREVLAAQVSRLGWTIPDQSKGGRTAKGNPGERDLLVQKDGITQSVVEAVVCSRPMTHEAMRKELAAHFQKLFAYDHCTIFFHLSYAYINKPATIVDYLKEMAEKEAPNAFKYKSSEDIPHTDSRPPGFVAEYEGQFGPVKVVFLVLDMAQEAQQEAANLSAVTKPR
jgi:hypothetical protein